MRIWSEMVAKNAKFWRNDFSFSPETQFLRNYAQRNSDWKPYRLCCYATARLLFFVHSSIRILEITITVPFSLMGLLSHGPARWCCVHVHKTYLRSLSLKSSSYITGLLDPLHYLITEGIFWLIWLELVGLQVEHCQNVSLKVSLNCLNNIMIGTNFA